MQKENVSSQMTCSELESLTADSLVQPQKASFPIVVTDSGISIAVRNVQYSNALLLIEVTEYSIPSLVMVDGIVTAVLSMSDWPLTSAYGVPPKLYSV